MKGENVENKEFPENAGKLAQNIHEQLMELNQSMEQMANDLSTMVGTTTEDVENRAKQIITSTSRYTERHPIKGMLFAAATGFMLGSIAAKVSNALQKNGR
jgi:ElaB/YqjD/DUF883 family membrane-anchored ribosome-binding protein